MVSVVEKNESGVHDAIDADALGRADLEGWTLADRVLDAARESRPSGGFLFNRLEEFVMGAWGDDRWSSYYFANITTPDYYPPLSQIRRTYEEVKDLGRRVRLCYEHRNLIYKIKTEFLAHPVLNTCRSYMCDSHTVHNSNLYDRISPSEVCDLYVNIKIIEDYLFSNKDGIEFGHLILGYDSDHRLEFRTGPEPYPKLGRLGVYISKDKVGDQGQLSLARGIAEAFHDFSWHVEGHDVADDPEEARARQEEHEVATDELLEVMIWTDEPRCPCCGLNR